MTGKANIRVAAGVLAAAGALAVGAPTDARAHGDDPPAATDRGLHRASSAKVIEQRTRFFGRRNVDQQTGAVDQGQVILSWVGNATFAAALAGHVVLLDAWTLQYTHPGWSPATAQDLADLDPDAIFIGHGHWDHAYEAGPVAAATGAAVVGTPAHCRYARRRAGARADAVRCIEAMPDGARFGAMRPLSLLEGVDITAVRHRHSPGLSPESMSVEPFLPESGDAGCPPPPNTHRPVKRPPDLGAEGLRQAHDASVGPGTRDGGVLLYQFRIGSFALAYQDSSASLKTTPELRDALAELPPTDVFTGSIATLNRDTRCMRDPRDYAEALRARMFVPNHHDDNSWQPIGRSGDFYGPKLHEEFSRIPAHRRPCLLLTADPADYVRPDRLTFDVRDQDPCLPGVQQALDTTQEAR